MLQSAGSGRAGERMSDLYGEDVRSQEFMDLLVELVSELDGPRRVTLGEEPLHGFEWSMLFRWCSWSYSSPLVSQIRSTAEAESSAWLGRKAQDA